MGKTFYINLQLVDASSVSVSFCNWKDEEDLGYIKDFWSQFAGMEFIFHYPNGGFGKFTAPAELISPVELIPRLHFTAELTRTDGIPCDENGKEYSCFHKSNLQKSLQY